MRLSPQAWTCGSACHHPCPSPPTAGIRDTLLCVPGRSLTLHSRHRLRISCSAQGWRGGWTAPHRRDSGFPEKTESILKMGSGAGKAGLLQQERQTCKLLLQPQTLQGGESRPRSAGHRGTFAERRRPISQGLLPVLSLLCVRSSICLLQVSPPQGPQVTWAGRGGSDLHEAPPPPDGGGGMK